MTKPIQGFDDALGRAIAAANDAAAFRAESIVSYSKAAADRDGGAHHRGFAERCAQQATVAASESQAWAAIAHAMTARNAEMLGAGT